MKTATTVFAILLVSLPLSFGADIKPGGSTIVKCDPCAKCPTEATAANCAGLFPRTPATAEECAALFPVVEQAPCPTATVSLHPCLRDDPVWVDVSAPVDDAANLVAPAPAKAHLKPWQRRAIWIGGGLIVGAILHHNLDDENGGDTKHVHRHYDCTGNGPDCNDGHDGD